MTEPADEVLRSDRPEPPDPYGAFAAVDGLGGVASPLMAGFAITLIALVIQVEAQLRWPNAVLVLLSSATVLFLQVIQLNARAKGYAVTPAQAAEWYDDMTDPGRQAVVLWELRHHRAAWSVLVRRARHRYNLGIVAHLAGGALMLVPAGAARLTGGRGVAIAVLGIGVCVELVDMAAQRLGARSPQTRVAGLVRRLVGWVTPLYPPVPHPPFDRRPPDGCDPADGETADPWP